MRSHNRFHRWKFPFFTLFLIVGLLFSIFAISQRQELRQRAADVPIAHIQTAATTDDGGADEINQTFSSANASGNLLVAAVSWSGGGDLSCSDSQGNTYTTVTSFYDFSKDQALGICYATNSNAGDNTITATFSSPAAFRRLIVHEYTGIATVYPVDVTIKNNANGTTDINSITSNSVITTVPGDLIFGATLDDTGTTDITAGTGFTQRNALNNKDLVTQDLVQQSPASIASTMTFRDAHRYIAQLVAFKPVSAPEITPTPTEIQPTGTPVPSAPTTLSFSLLLHGLGQAGDSANPNSTGNINPARTQRTITVEIVNAQNQQVLSKQTSVSYEATNGSFKGFLTTDTLPAGVYTIKVKTDQYLRAIIPGIQTITTGQNNFMPETRLITGDINNDNVINIVDYNVLLGCYSDLSPATNCPGDKDNADLTDDGAVNAFDYNLFLRELTNRIGEPTLSSTPY